MLPYKLEAGEFQFVEGQAIMSYPLEPVYGSSINLTLYGDKKCRVAFLGIDDEILHFVEGQTLKFDQQILGFSKMEIRCTPSTSYAVRAYVNDLQNSEYNDGIPVVLTPDITYDQRVDQEAQMAVVREMSGLGFSQEAIMDLLTGLNTNDDDLDFEDEEDLPSEAEMAEMINEARQAASNAPDSLVEDSEPVKSEKSDPTPPDED